MFTLLIWEEIPEETKFYLIPNEVAAEHEAFLKNAHHHFINEVDWNKRPGLLFLNTALGEEMPEAGYEKYLGIFRKYETPHNKPLTGQNITTVYLSGFFL